MSIYSTCLSPLQERGCTFHRLLSSATPVLEEFADGWRDSDGEFPSALRLCESTSTPPELTRLVLGKKADICFTGYVCRAHENTILHALHTHVTDLKQIEGGVNTCYYPLTSAEADGGFDLAPAPGEVFTAAREASMLWQEVTLPGHVINGLGGRLSGCDETEITVSCYVYGHTDPSLVTDNDELMSFVYFPVLEVLAKIPTEQINGTAGAEWLPKTLLRQSRMLPTYKDGVTMAGTSMFNLKAKSLQEAIDGFLEAERTKRNLMAPWQRKLSGQLQQSSGQLFQSSVLALTWVPAFGSDTQQTFSRQTLKMSQLARASHCSTRRNLASHYNT